MRYCKLLMILWIVPVLLFAEVNGKKPQRIVLGWQQNPDSSQSVAWRTIEHLDNAKAQIAPVSAWAKKFDDNAQTFKAVAQDITTRDDGPFTHYNVNFTGLVPGAQYAYRVGSRGNWSEWNLFRTADSGNSPFTFLYIGDIQNGIFSQTSPLLRRMMLDAQNARFVLIAGDLVSKGYKDSQWGELFDAFGFIPRMVPLVPAAGNHDSPGEIKDVYANPMPDPLYLAHFALPENGPDVPLLKESAYTLDYQCARFVVFNSNTWNNREQLAWLESALQSNTRPWLVVMFHHPVYSTGRGRDNDELRATLAPILEKHGVDLVLQGHDHHYGRTGKVAADTLAPNNANAPVYVVSVSGPKMYGDSDHSSHLLQKELGKSQLYQVIHVSPDSLNYVSKDLTGEVVDSFSLVKQSEGTMLKEQGR